jgi:iron(II)-dependent oxidoreductase
MALGVALGKAGDPRLAVPSDDAYWVRMVSDDDDPLIIGRYPVTNAEFKAWVDGGGYADRSAWTDEGWAWLQGAESPWPQGIDAELLVPNQPVVAVTFHEAEAYATAHGARLVRTDERLWVVRGEEKRPYPWGAPFGEGNANTREEAVGRPCAVGLFTGDCTPEGVSDLAGNVAEWTGDDEVDYVDFDAVDEGEEPPIRTCRTIHPGAWNQPALAAWAKAKALVVPESRWNALGFRLARDA